MSGYNVTLLRNNVTYMATPLFQEDLLVLVQAPSRMQVGHSIGYFMV
jgi:hypothetical protein